MLNIYSMKITEAEKLDEQFCLSKFPKRVRRAEKFYKHDDRLRSLSAGYLMYSVLGATEDDIGIDDNGKPYLIDGGVEFNLSHGGRYAVMAVSDRVVGIDVEQISDNHLDVATSVFQKDELEWMNGHAENFYILWTLKEAVTKLEGSGIIQSPKSFSVLPLITGGFIDYQGYMVYGDARIFDGHVISVCSLEKQIILGITQVTSE